MALRFRALPLVPTVRCSLAEMGRVRSICGKKKTKAGTKQSYCKRFQVIQLLFGTSISALTAKYSPLRALIVRLNFGAPMPRQAMSHSPYTPLRVTQEALRL